MRDGFRIAPCGISFFVRATGAPRSFRHQFSISSSTAAAWKPVGVDQVAIGAQRHVIPRSGYAPGNISYTGEWVHASSLSAERPPGLAHTASSSRGRRLRRSNPPRPARTLRTSGHRCRFRIQPPTAASFPKIKLAIAHLRNILGEQTYEARKGETTTTASMVSYDYDQSTRPEQN